MLDLVVGPLLCGAMLLELLISAVALKKYLGLLLRWALAKRILPTIARGERGQAVAIVCSKLSIHEIAKFCPRITCDRCIAT